MKNIKIFLTLCLISMVTFSCKSDDDSSEENDQQNNDPSITFTINSVEQTLTNITALPDPTDSTLRRVEGVLASDSSQRIRFFIPINQTGEITQFVYTTNGVNYQCNHTDCGGASNISIHTNTKMTGTFSYTITDTLGDPIFTITNGAIDITY